MMDAIEQADAKRIGDKTEKAVALADKQRMAAAKREGELNRIAGALPDDPQALWMYAESSLTQAVISTIDAGRALIKLKELLPHGVFGPELESRGITARTARLLMQTAAKFSDRSEKFMKLSRSKLFACLELSDDELDALEDGESILDMDLDKMDRMTVRELKAAIKKKDVDLGIKDRLLGDKDKLINETAEENDRLRGGVAAGDESPFVREVASERAQILIPLIRLKNRALIMEANLNESGAVDRAEYFALQAALDCLRDEMAQAMDAIFNAGAKFQASIASASLPSDDTYAGMN